MSPRREILAGRASVAGPEGGAAAAPGDGADPIERGDPGMTRGPVPFDGDGSFEVGIRPKRLADFVGQQTLREKLEIILEAARRREQPVDHVLFAGPPGLGKTTLAGIMACEMGAGLRITSGPALVRSGDVAAILTDLQPGDVLFIDEIHRMGRAVEELLYPAMEDFQLDIVLGRGPTARSIRLDLPKFTLVGATTRTGLITGPLRDRFGIVARLELYSEGELEAIVHRTGVLFGVELTDEGANEIARRSRGTPRLAIRLLRRVRDFVEVRGEGVITEEAAREGLTLFGVDELGLDSLDRKILETLCIRFAGRPVGLSTLAVSVGEEQETVEDVYEPFLLQAGLIMRTPRGRLAAPGAYAHLGLAVPAQLLSALSIGDAESPEGASPRRTSRAGAAQDSLFGADPEEEDCTKGSGLGD